MNKLGHSYSYVWRPPTRQQQQSRSRRYSDPLLGDSLDLLTLNTHPRYLFASHQPDTTVRERGSLPKIGQTPQDIASVCEINIHVLYYST